MFQKILILIYLFAFISCQKKDVSDDKHQKIILETYYSSDAAHCIAFDSFFTGVLASYFHSSQKINRNQFILKFTKNPSLFQNVNQIYFFPWHVSLDENNQAYMHKVPVPLPFDIKNLKTGRVLNQRELRGLSFNQLNKYLKKYSSPSEFYEKNVFILKGLEKYHGIHIYNANFSFNPLVKDPKNKGPRAIDEESKTTVMLGPLHPNPYEQAKERLFSAFHYLKSLHPLWKKRHQDLKNSDYIFMMHEMCDQLF